MNLTNQYTETLSTVQLSPFNESQWHRLVTYPSIPIDFTEPIMVNQQTKSSSARLNVIGPIDIDMLKIEDAMLLKELQTVRKIVPMPSFNKKQKEKKIAQVEDEHDRRTTSPTDEYERSFDVFYRTREPPISHRTSNEKQVTFHSQITPQSPNTSHERKESLPNLAQQPQLSSTSLRVQLQQATHTRHFAMGLMNDRRSISPLSMASSKRAVGAIVQPSRRPRQTPRTLHGQTPILSEASLASELKDQIDAELASISSARRSSYRQKNPSRTSMHMLKTKNERIRQKQHVELKTLFVKPCRKPIRSDCALDDSIPNSIEIMRRLGGPVTPFEHHLRHSYQRHLSQFRNGSIQC